MNRHPVVEIVVMSFVLGLSLPSLAQTEVKSSREFAALTLGMTQQDVSKSLGEPAYREAFEAASGANISLWFYDQNELEGRATTPIPLIFENGRLVAWGRSIYQKKLDTYLLPARAAPTVPALSAPTVTAAAPSPPIRASGPAQQSDDDSDAVKRFGLSISTRVGQLVTEKGHDRVYPREARAHKWEGVTQVTVDYAMGEAKQTWVAKSSGYALLDQRAVELVQQVLPKMTPPLELRKRSQFTVTLPIVFKLQDRY